MVDNSKLPRPCHEPSSAETFHDRQQTTATHQTFCGCKCSRMWIRRLSHFREKISFSFCKEQSYTDRENRTTTNRTDGLLAAHIAQHITGTILVTCWSKSQIRIDWIRTAKLLKGFIANRDTEIRQLTSDCDLRYCPTYKNQIDLQMNLSRLIAVRYRHMYRDGFVSTEA